MRRTRETAQFIRQHEMLIADPDDPSLETEWLQVPLLTLYLSPSPSVSVSLPLPLSRARDGVAAGACPDPLFFFPTRSPLSLPHWRRSGCRCFSRPSISLSYSLSSVSPSLETEWLQVLLHNLSRPSPVPLQTLSGPSRWTPPSHITPPHCPPPRPRPCPSLLRPADEGAGLAPPGRTVRRGLRRYDLRGRENRKSREIREREGEKRESREREGGHPTPSSP